MKAGAARPGSAEEPFDQFGNAAPIGGANGSPTGRHRLAGCASRGGGAGKSGVELCKSRYRGGGNGGGGGGNDRWSCAGRSMSMEIL